jgi:regulator of protease activity HflC (stomatin/prohibitin superfamily)
MPGMRPLAALVAVALASSGCATATIQPGHRGLLFAPKDGGLRRDVLQPGVYPLGACFIACTQNRVDDFDVTYSTRAERLQVRSAEGLEIELALSVVYRPIISELYQLDTEIGQNYYDEVIGPEFRSASRGVFARRSYVDLERKDGAIEDELENELRRRTAGKHLEIASVTLERVAYAPEIVEANRKRIADEAEAKRARVASENEFAAKKRAVEQEMELKRLREAPACAGPTAGTP